MSNDFTVQTNSKTFTKFIDANGNGVKDSGEKFATIDFTNDGDKAKTFKMRGDVSLFTTNEIASNLSTRSFASSSTSLPTENGKVKINPCNEYSVGDLANTLKNGGSNGSSAYGATGSVTTTSTTNMLPSEYYENIGKLYSPVITTAAITDDVSGYSKNASNFIELEAAFLFGTATTAQTTTQTSSASSANSNAVNGFALDPNSSTADGACSTGSGAEAGSGKPDCTDVEKQLADAQKALADAKKCKSGFDENGKCKDDSSVGATPSMTGVGSAGNGNDADSARKSGNHHGLTERGDGSGIYASSDANTDIPVIFNKDQWLSKTAIAMYGKGAENDADLIEALAILNKNAINNGNASDIDEGACLTFPQQLEYKGKFYSMEPANRDKDKVQVDADKVRLEIGSSKSGHSAAARREAGVSVNSPVASAKPQSPEVHVATAPVKPKLFQHAYLNRTETQRDYTDVVIVDKEGHRIKNNKPSANKNDETFFSSIGNWFTERAADLVAPVVIEAASRPSVQDALATGMGKGIERNSATWIPGTSKVAVGVLQNDAVMNQAYDSIVNAYTRNPERLSAIIDQEVTKKLSDWVKQAIQEAGSDVNEANVMRLTQTAMRTAMTKEGQALMAQAYPEIAKQITDPKNKALTAQLTEFVKQQVMAQLDTAEVKAAIKIAIADSMGDMTVAGLSAVSMDRKARESADSTVKEYNKSKK